MQPVDEIQHLLLEDFGVQFDAVQVGLEVQNDVVRLIVEHGPQGRNGLPYQLLNADIYRVRAVVAVEHEVSVLQE